MEGEIIKKILISLTIIIILIFSLALPSYAFDVTGDFSDLFSVQVVHEADGKLTIICSLKNFTEVLWFEDGFERHRYVYGRSITGIYDDVECLSCFPMGQSNPNYNLINCRFFDGIDELKLYVEFGGDSIHYAGKEVPFLPCFTFTTYGDGIIFENEFSLVDTFYKYGDIYKDISSPLFLTSIEVTLTSDFLSADYLDVNADFVGNPLFDFTDVNIFLDTFIFQFQVDSEDELLNAIYENNTLLKEVQNQLKEQQEYLENQTSGQESQISNIQGIIDNQNSIITEYDSKVDEIVGNMGTPSSPDLTFIDVLDRTEYDIFWNDSNLSSAMSLFGVLGSIVFTYCLVRFLIFGKG